MKILCITLLVLCHTVSLVQAGRQPIQAISSDPYVSAMVLDADSGQVLFAENADSRVYPASVLKLMDLYVILERIQQGSLRLDEMVQVTAEAAKTGGSQVYLDPKEQFSVEDLLYALMVQSANDAAVTLATHIAGSKEGFIALMNQKAQELGMRNTRFHSVHGLPPSEGQEPDATTAADFAILCRELVKNPETFKYTATQSRGFRGDKFIMRNHNKLLSQVSGCDGLKTGYFQAGGFSIAATAKKGGVRIITLVMGSKDRKMRDAKAAELLGKGFSMVPPRPEAAAAPVKSTPAPTSQSSMAAPGVQAPSPVQRASDAAPQPPGEPGQADNKGGRDSSFLLGLGAGVLACLLLLGIFGLLMKKRRRSGINRRF